MIIFEGIATSGKSTMIEKLKEKLAGQYSIATFPEDETLLPIVKNKDIDVALRFLWNFIEKRLQKTEADVLLVDRLYFTHIFRTKSTNRDFRVIENFLLNTYDAGVIFLFVDENTLEKRIKGAESLRGDWGQGKKGTMEERVAYYVEQQGILRDAISKSRIPHIACNTTKMEWDRYGASIISFSKL